MNDKILRTLLEEMYPDGLPSSPTGEVIKSLTNKKRFEVIESRSLPVKGDLL